MASPIRNPNKVKQILSMYQKRSKRDYMILFVGFYTALRVADLVELKVKDVKGKRILKIKEKKTGKYREYEMPPSLVQALEKYCKGRDGEEYLFLSRQYAPKRLNKEGAYFEKGNTPVSRQRVWQLMKDIEKEFGLEDISCHTLRKTFGYQHYRMFKNLATLMKILNHRSIEETKIYIGLVDEEVNHELRHFDYA